MKENHNIDELLNSFIDGELSPRQQIEVQRLIGHDPEVAKKLQQLQKCKHLVSSLPLNEAPAEIAVDIKAALERKTLLGTRHADFEERRGQLHLFARKFVAAAAMIGLVGILAAVVYSILSPAESEPKKVMARKQYRPAAKVMVQKSEVKQINPSEPATTPQAAVVTEKPTEKLAAAPRAPKMAFSGKVELKVSDVAAADAYISRALEDNGLSPRTSPMDTNRKIYSINCSEETLQSLLGRLKGVWDRFDSARLLVDDGAIAVDDVTVEQIYKIAAQAGHTEQMQTAKNYAALNSMNQRLPGKEVMTAVNDKQDILTNIPRPVLTSKEKAKDTAAGEDDKRINLTIVIMPVPSGLRP